jgi:branched-subunit amino acid ABC-type transport system permease component
VDTTSYKVLAFVIGAFFAGVSGGLFAHYLSYLNPNSFTFLKSIEVIAMVVLGGMGSVSGSVLAAIILTMLPEVLRPVKDYRMVIYADADHPDDHASSGLLGTAFRRRVAAPPGRGRVSHGRPAAASRA